MVTHYKMKQCSKCKELKGENEFHKQKNTRDGIRPDCKACVCLRQRQSYDQKSDEFKSGQYIKNKCPKCGGLKTRYSVLCQECARPTQNPENPTWYKNRDGYMTAIVKGKREIRQHRFIMEKIIGRPLLSHESVHHKNGVRDDNRPENLELWSSSHPSGQRIEDKVAWALEILALYGKMNVLKTSAETSPINLTLD